MTEKLPPMFKITVFFARRDDGGLRAESDDIPEFYVAGPNPESVLRDVIPVMEKILRHNYGHTIRVYPLSDLSAVRAEIASGAAKDEIEPILTSREPKTKKEYVGVQRDAA